MFLCTGKHVSGLDVSGTYVHPDLIPAIMVWASPKYSLTCARIMKNLLIYHKSQNEEALIDFDQEEEDEEVDTKNKVKDVAIFKKRINREGMSLEMKKERKFEDFPYMLISFKSGTAVKYQMTRLRRTYPKCKCLGLVPKTTPTAVKRLIDNQGKVLY
jgi:hypothetical protein